MRASAQVQLAHQQQQMEAMQATLHAVLEGVASLQISAGKGPLPGLQAK
eukprot:gene963-3246_t